MKKNIKSNVTLKQVADALGVSMMTVSRAINDRPNVDTKTRSRIIEKAQELGYTPNHVAKSLVSQKTDTIGIIIPRISHSFFPEVVRGIEEVAYDLKYQLFLTNTSEDFEREKRNIEALRSKRVDGLMISTSLAEADYSFYERIIKSGLPLVFFDRCIEGIGASCISVNDRESSMMITEHLIGHGYKKIAHLSGPQKVAIGKKRMEGYFDALKTHNMDADNRWVVEGGFTESGGYQAMKQLLQLPKTEQPRAVIAVNDPAAFGAIDAIRDHGLSVPHDIAVVGFSNEIRSSLISCPLTTIHQPAYEVGKLAVNKLINTIEKEDEPVENLVVKTSLKIRLSCGCT